MHGAKVRADVARHLQPNFDNHESLLAYLRLIQAPEQRAEKPARKCDIQLGKAALHVQRFCAPGALLNW